MQATQVSETIGGSIPHETILDAMREDGYVAQKLPEWKSEAIQRPEPRIERRDTLQLTEHVSVTVQHDGIVSGGYLYIGFYNENYHWPENSTDTERQRTTLQFMLAEAEKAVRVMKAMLASEKHQWKTLR